MPDSEQGRPAGPVVRASELPIWRDAAAMLAAARTEAASLREDASAYRAAEAERGYGEGQARAASLLSSRLLELDQAAAVALAGMERALPGLVCDLVAQMLGQVPACEGLRLAVRQALTRLRRGTTATVRVAPADRPVLDAVLAEAGPAALGLAIETDPALVPGRCLLESGLGSAEIGLEAQIRVLRETMAARWDQAA